MARPELPYSREPVSETRPARRAGTKAAKGAATRAAPTSTPNPPQGGANTIASPPPDATSVISQADPIPTSRPHAAPETGARLVARLPLRGM